MLLLLYCIAHTFRASGKAYIVYLLTKAVGKHRCRCRLYTDDRAYVLMKHWQATVSMRAGTVTLPAQKYGLACHSARPSFIAARSCLLRIIQLRRGSFLFLGPYSSVRLLPCSTISLLSLGKQNIYRNKTHSLLLLTAPSQAHARPSDQDFPIWSCLY